jgi:hypothetical protein
MNKNHCNSQSRVLGLAHEPSTGSLSLIYFFILITLRHNVCDKQVLQKSLILQHFYSIRYRVLLNDPTRSTSHSSNETRMHLALQALENNPKTSFQRAASTCKVDRLALRR